MFFINSRELCPEQVCKLRGRGVRIVEGQIIRAMLYQMTSISARFQILVSSICNSKFNICNAHISDLESIYISIWVVMS